jgi:hypothetical protein
MSSRSRPDPDQNVLPAKWVQRRVMLKVKPVTKMKWRSRQHLQFTVDIKRVRVPRLRRSQPPADWTS